jgi:hypothetical protein
VWFSAQGPKFVIMNIEYPAKIIVAWGEAIGGNKKIRDWLLKNGYPELGLFVFALNNRQEARQWLLDNNHPHLMALIRGCEGDPNAILWLRKYKFDVLEKIALAGDNNDDAMMWLVRNNFKDFAVIAMNIKVIKNDIQKDNDDVHKFNIE